MYLRSCFASQLLCSICTELCNQFHKINQEFKKEKLFRGNSFQQYLGSYPI